LFLAIDFPDTNTVPTYDQLLIVTTVCARWVHVESTF